MKVRIARGFVLVFESKEIEEMSPECICARTRQDKQMRGVHYAYRYRYGYHRSHVFLPSLSSP